MFTCLPEMSLVLRLFVWYSICKRCKSSNSSALTNTAHKAPSILLKVLHLLTAVLCESTSHATVFLILEMELLDDALGSSKFSSCRSISSTWLTCTYFSVHLHVLTPRIVVVGGISVARQLLMLTSTCTDLTRTYLSYYSPYWHWALSGFAHLFAMLTVT